MYGCPDSSASRSPEHRHAVQQGDTSAASHATDAAALNHHDTTLAARLKAHTADLHQQAGSSPFAHRLINGQIQLHEIATLLRHALLVHQELESHAQPLIERCEAFARLNPTWRQRSRSIESAIDELPAPASSEPMEITTRFCADLRAAAEQDPLAIAGGFYVVEGANNGNRMIYPNWRKTLGDRAAALEPYMDPHGPGQPAAWAAFKEALNAIQPSKETADSIARTAQSTFRYYLDLYDSFDTPLAAESHRHEPTP
ncbi:MAG: biliverdin-producing heme oxygenase [Planctomycetota bacterium]